MKLLFVAGLGASFFFLLGLALYSPRQTGGELVFVGIGGAWFVVWYAIAARRK